MTNPHIIATFRRQLAERSKKPAKVTHMVTNSERIFAMFTKNNPEMDNVFTNGTVFIIPIEK